MDFGVIDNYINMKKFKKIHIDVIKFKWIN